MAYRNDPEVARYHRGNRSRGATPRIHRGAEPAIGPVSRASGFSSPRNQARWNTGGRLRFAGPQIGTANRRDRLYVSRAAYQGNGSRLRPRAQWWITDSSSLGLGRIIATCDSRNLRSIALMNASDAAGRDFVQKRLVQGRVVRRVSVRVLARRVDASPRRAKLVQTAIP